MVRRSSLCLIALLGCGRSGVYRYESFPEPPDAGAFDAGVDAGEVDAGPVPCVPGHITLVKATPVAMLVLDRSSSMGFKFDETTRWKALTEGLAEALPPVDQTMQLGSLTYPLAGGGGLACVPASGPDFLPAKGNVDAIIAKMRNASPSGSTPTADSVEIAGNWLAGVRATKQGRALVLATDGAPDCNGALDATSCTCVTSSGTGGGRCEAARCLDDTRTVARVASLADAGMPTYVIGIQSTAGDATLQRVLNDLANAGGRPQRDAGTQYYAVTSKSELDGALVTIRDQVGACVYLARSVPDRDEAMTVTLQGVGLVPYDPTGTSGWSWSDKANGELFMSGAACDEIRATMSPVLDALVACDEP